MTVIEGFNTVEAYVSETGYVCFKQESIEFGKEVLVLFPIHVWNSLRDSLDYEIKEFERGEIEAIQENLDNE